MESVGGGLVLVHGEPAGGNPSVGSSCKGPSGAPTIDGLEEFDSLATQEGMDVVRNGVPR